jgi:hypothetical protein
MKGGGSHRRQPSPMRRKPSDARRHGFAGSPEGMEMTDPPPLEPASTTDSTPPSAALPVPSSIAEEEEEPPTISSIPSRQQTDTSVDATPTKPRKRRLFSTPSSSRKAKHKSPQQRQPSTTLSPQPPRNTQSSTSASVTTPPPPQSKTRTQFKTPGSATPGSRTGRLSSSARQQSSGGRSRGRRQPPAALSGLSGLSPTTPRSSRKQRLPASSGRRGFNPLSRIQDIFSPQSPSFLSRASPIPFEFPGGGASDSSASDASSASGSVKEPFTEQVSRLDELLATPSQHLGELGMTITQNEGEDDDLDAEMEDLESSRRMLADELSRVDFSILDDGGGYGGSDGGTPNRSSPGFWGSNSRTKNKGKTNIENEEDGWVPLLTAEENPPPNFSPIQVGQSESESDQDYSSPLKSTPSSDRSNNRIKETTIISVDGDTTIIPGEEFYNTLETPPRDEAKVEKKSVEKERQNQSNTSPLIPSSIFKVSRKIKYDSLNTPPKRKSDDKLATSSNQKDKNSTSTILFVAGGEVEENLHSPVQNPSSSTPLPGRLKIIETKEKETETSGKKNYNSLQTPPREKLPEILDTKCNQKNTNSSSAISSSSIASGRFKIVEKKGTKASSKKNYTQLKTPPKGKKGGRKQEKKVQAVDYVVSTNDQLYSSVVVPSIASEVEEDSKPAAQQKLTPPGRLKIVEKKEGKVFSNKKNIDITTLLETPPKGEKKEELVTTGDRKQGNNIVQTDDSVGSTKYHKYLSAISSVAGEVEVEEGSKPATQKSPPGRLKIVEKTGGDVEILDQSNVAESSPPRFDPFGFGSGISSESSPPISPIENTSTERSPSNIINTSVGDTTLSSIAVGISSEESVRSPLASKNESVFQSLVSFAERISDRTPERQVEHSTRVLENLNSILTPPDNRPRDEIDKRLPAITPERRVLSLAEDHTGEGQGDEENVFNTPPRDQDPSPPLSAETDNLKTEKVVIEGSNDSILGLSPISQSSEQLQSSLNTLESARLLETSPGRDCIPESEEPSDRESTPTPETVGASESNDIKQIKSHDRSIIVSILPDDSDDEIMFDEESPQHTDDGEFDYEQPPDPPDHSKTDHAFDQSKMPKNYDGGDNPDALLAKKYSKNAPVHPSRNCKKICLIVAILAFVIGLGLVLGTIFITSGNKNLAPSPVPTLMPTPTTMPDFSVTPSPTPTTTLSTSDAPTPIDTVSFTIPYIIYIANGLVDFVPQSEYVPELVMSMDSLSSDILLNISKKRRMRGGRRKLTTVILPTKIIGVSDIACPNYVMNSLCQEIVSKISLVDGEDSWQEFKDTTELAIEIGRLQYYLERVDPDSPVEVIDAVWTPPAPTPASSPTVAAPIDFSSSDMPSDFPSLNPSSITTHPPSFSLLDLLVENSFDDGEALNSTSSPQYMAYSWLLEDKFLMEYSRKRILQRYSLATFYYATNGDQWLKNDFWLSDRTECHWYSKTGSRTLCNEEQELVNLELDINNIYGSLPPEIGLLSSSLERIVSVIKNNEQHVSYIYTNH